MNHTGVHSSSSSSGSSASSSHKNTKLRAYREQLQQSALMGRAYNTYLDKEALETVYRIASELLESIDRRKKLLADAPTTTMLGADGETTVMRMIIPSVGEVEFESPTAELVLKRNNGDSGLERSSNSSDADLIDDLLERDSNEVKFQLRLLTGDQANYKKALQYLGHVMNFKVTYQSVKMVGFSLFISF